MYYFGRGGRANPTYAATAPTEETMRLKDKVAIITGAASGMGASTARIFAQRGRQGDPRRRAGSGGPRDRAVDRVRRRRRAFPETRRGKRGGLGGGRRGHARGLRQDRRPDQQRRGERQRPGPAEPHHLGPADVDQRQGRVSRHARRDPGDAEGQARLDRQHLVDLGHRRPKICAHGLQRRQGRGAHDDQGGSRAVRAPTASASTRCIRA